MSDRDQYMPGAAYGAEMRSVGDACTLILIREFPVSPEKLWQALTEPAYLSEWAPFDASDSLGVAGAKVKLATIGAPEEHSSETEVAVAMQPELLLYDWGGQQMRWELKPVGSSTRLTLTQVIDCRFIPWGAAGWHLCLDVLKQMLSGKPVGRIVGPEAMKFDWPRLNVEYAGIFGVEAPNWPPKA